MKSTLPLIHIEYPAIDDAEFEGNPVLRGVIKVEDLEHLRIDNAYQREFLSLSTRRYILEALSTKQRLPDLELGMRGQSWEFIKDSSEIIVLNDPVFIIDGQQRRGTILEYLKNNPEETVRQGALIHFGSTMEWERKRFHALNLHQTSVSSGILLRNLRSTSPGIATLYGLAVSDKDFPLLNRVSWNQSMLRQDLISANLYVRNILWTHGHLGGGIVASSVNAIETGIERLTKIIGLPQLRANIKAHWNSIERAWGIKELSHKGSPWMTHAFLNAYCNVISDHYDFWTGSNQTELKFPSSIMTKLEKFPITDPEIRALSSGSGQGRVTLQFHLEQWLNKYSPMTKRDVIGNINEHKSIAVRNRYKNQKNQIVMEKTT